jgi:hypothetical protein
MQLIPYNVAVARCEFSRKNSKRGANRAIQFTPSGNRGIGQKTQMKNFSEEKINY